MALKDLLSSMRSPNDRLTELLQGDPPVKQPSLPDWLRNPAPTDATRVAKHPERMGAPTDSVEVVLWHPSGSGFSSLGHMSATVGDSAYSYGPTGLKVFTPQGYVDKNDFREGLGLTMRVNPTQKRIIDSTIQSYRDKPYLWFTNNCTSPVKSALNQAGIPIDDDPLPNSVARSIIQRPEFIGSKTYPQRKPSEGMNGPWAK